MSARAQRLRERARPIRSVLAAVGLCFICLCAWPGGLEAQEMALPVANQWSLYDRILSFDRTFEDRDEDGIVVGILYQSRYRSSLNSRDDLLELSRQASLQLGGRDVRFVEIEVTSLTEVGLQLMENNVDVVYFTPLRAVDLSEYVELSARHQLVTLTGVREYVDLGIGIGLGLRGGRPELLINLPSCRAQGMELSSELLKMATVLTDGL